MKQGYFAICGSYVFLSFFRLMCVCMCVSLPIKKRTCRSENLQPALPQSRTCCIFFGPAFHWPARCVELSLFQRQATMSLGCRSSSGSFWVDGCKQSISLDELVSIRSGFSSFFKAEHQNHRQQPGRAILACLPSKTCQCFADICILPECYETSALMSH